MALTFPSSPSNGQLYTDTVTGYRYVYNATAGVWSFSANSVGMSISSVPPANVAPGAMWFNREIGRTFIYYDDGDSKQWVETVPATGSFDSSTVASYANVAAQIYYTPVYNTTNAAYASINSNWTTTNAAFSKANSALANTTNVVFQGNLTVTGALTIGTGTTTITTDSINVGNVLIVTSQGMTIPSGNTSQRPASAPLGTIRYNTQTDALENYTTSGWLKVSIPIPGIASLSGSIYYSNTTTLTLTGSGFGTAQGNVTFTSGATVAYSNATPTNDASVSFTVPSTIYNLAVGSSVSIKYTNYDGGISGSITTSVLSLPTGGTITTSGGYRYHTFTSSGSFVVPNTAITSIDATIVAGGGGGARNRGGGGGAGGMVNYTSIGNVTTGTYTVTIGAGGQPQTASQDSNQGNSTTFSGGAISWSVTGGGRGGGNGIGTNYAGGNGGSGGGAGSNASQSGGSGTAGQGNAGGSTGGYNSGAGGGGKGSAGGNATGSTSVPVPGGSGLAGVNGTTYATGGAGGVGVDAAGGGASGAANSGNGGDGGSGNVDGGTGGSGIVVIRYTLP